MQPTVLDQLADLRVLSQNRVDLLGRSLDEDTQSERLVDEALPVWVSHLDPETYRSLPADRQYRGSSQTGGQ